jgi:tripartite ATP-independent transporter DctP family solute receptor
MREFKRIVEERSAGRMKVDLFYAGVLGTNAAMVQQVQSGALSLTLPGLAFLQGFLPQMRVLTLPYLVTTREQMLKLVDGPIGQRLAKALEAVGLKALGYMDVGPRQVFNNVRPIATPADIKGLKIRVQTNPAHIAFIEALGAIPVAMDFTEVYNSVKTRTVDGFDGTVYAAVNAKFYEVVRYLTILNFSYEYLGVVMSLTQFNNLPSDLQKIVLDAGQAHITFQRKAQAEGEVTILDQWKATGDKPVATLTPEQIKAFRDIALPTWTKSTDVIGSDLMTQLNETLKTFN